MNVDISPGVIEAISDIQQYDGYHEILAGVENFIIEECSENNAFEAMDKIKILRIISKLLLKLNPKVESNE
jgi:hypothetical protein